MTTPLRIAITIFPEAMALDWVGPLDILNTLSKEEGTKPKSIPSVKIVIVGDTLTPIKQSNGMMVTPEITYETARSQEWDAVLVPGGQGARPWYESNKACRDFLVEVVPKCRFVFTVCTGSWLLSATGFLKGEKATCNKRAFASVLEQTKDLGVIWVPKARSAYRLCMSRDKLKGRWVVSNKFWTSSGITAGIDMAAAFVKYWVELHVGPEDGKAISDDLLGVTEVIASDQNDDPWAEYYKLV